MATAKAPRSNSSRQKLNQAYHLAGEAATETAQQLTARARSSMLTNRKRVTDLAGKTQTSIKQHPVLSVGCAFAAGWVIAKLFKR